MINNKFEEYKIRRELLRSGNDYTFYRNGTNEFGEPVEKSVEIGTFKGLYHEQNSNIQISTGDTTQTRTKKIPMILCLFDDISGLDLKTGDFVIINSRTFKLTGIVNISEWNIVTDISLELVDDVTED